MSNLQLKLWYNLQRILQTVTVAEFLNISRFLNIDTLIIQNSIDVKIEKSTFLDTTPVYYKIITHRRIFIHSSVSAEKWASGTLDGNKASEEWQKIGPVAPVSRKRRTGRYRGERGFRRFCEFDTDRPLYLSSEGARVGERRRRRRRRRRKRRRRRSAKLRMKEETKPVLHFIAFSPVCLSYCH